VGFHVGVGMLEDSEGDEVTLISAEGDGGLLGISASVANDREVREAMHCCYSV
jgi:hypothetical protein